MEVERNVDNPNTDSHYYRGLLSVPNGNTDDLNERLIRGIVASGSVREDVHAKNDQKRRGRHRHEGSQLET